MSSNNSPQMRPIGQKSRMSMVARPSLSVALWQIYQGKVPLEVRKNKADAIYHHAILPPRSEL